MVYELEELIPIVAELAEKYTGFESTSITYERAEQLMEAVQYCIRECEGEELPGTAEKPSAEQAYRHGRKLVKEKVKRTRELYNEMMKDFCSYGNRNYHDTVAKGFSGFFRFYDAVFAPQETILTMDYPALCPVQGKTGIDAIEEYVKRIYAEQRFLGKLPKRYVLDVLEQSDGDYREQFSNIAKAAERDILAHMMLKKPLDQPLDPGDREELRQEVRRLGKAAVSERMTELLKYLIREKYENDEEILDTLCGDLEDFCVEIQEGIRK